MSHFLNVNQIITQLAAVGNKALFIEIYLLILQNSENR